MRVALAALAVAAAPELESPRPYEAFFGRVSAAAPRGATTADVFLGGRRAGRARVTRGRAVVRVRGAPGRYDAVVRFDTGARRASRRVWLLPPTARQARRERSRDPALARRLAALGAAYPGYAGLWLQDLRSGRTAGWNSDASFPAASTVKLAVLVAALDRFGPRPERSAAWKEILDVAVWSSNLASNRLLVRLGGSEAGGARIVQERLWRLGARSSTFTGNYRLGTSVRRPGGDTPRPLPLLTYRRTTAHDLGRILFELHAAAVGNGLALRRTGLTRHEARVALGLLLSSDSRGENRGLLVDALPGTPLAQKHGWTTSVRHTAALVYRPDGPTIAVVLTYAPRIDARASARLGARVSRLVTG